MIEKIPRIVKAILQRCTPSGRAWRAANLVRHDLHSLRQALQAVHNDLRTNCQDVHAVHQEMEVLRQEMHTVQHDVQSDRQDLQAVHQEMHLLKQMVESLQTAIHQHSVKMEQALPSTLPYKEREYGSLLRFLRKSRYVEDIRSGVLPIPELKTEHPLAGDTNDTIHPRGSKNDNSIVPRFNQRLYDLLGRDRQLKILDIGCAGGGFVRTLLDDGHIAVGLDGSDFPKRTQSGEWSTIPHHLHTCDITKPFTIRDPRCTEAMRFDAITAWEVLEHIREPDLPHLLDNIRRHLAPHGYFLASVATFEDYDAEHGWVYHNTVKPKEWWLERFAREGLVAVEFTGIGKDDWVRGSGHCWGDWHEDQGCGFHCALVHAPAARREDAPADQTGSDKTTAAAPLRPHFVPKGVKVL